MDEFVYLFCVFLIEVFIILIFYVEIRYFGCDLCSVGSGIDVGDLVNVRFISDDFWLEDVNIGVEWGYCFDVGYNDVFGWFGWEVYYVFFLEM